jgi:hypothetical protein
MGLTRRVSIQLLEEKAPETATETLPSAGSVEHPGPRQNTGDQLQKARRKKTASKPLRVARKAGTAETQKRGKHMACARFGNTTQPQLGLWRRCKPLSRIPCVFRRPCCVPSPPREPGCPMFPEVGRFAEFSSAF